MLYGGNGIDHNNGVLSANNGANVFINLIYLTSTDVPVINATNDGVCVFDCGTCSEWETCEQGTDTQCTGITCTIDGDECAIADSDFTAVCNTLLTCEACVNDLTTDPSTTTCEAGYWCDENLGTCYAGECSTDTDCDMTRTCGENLLCE